jgi:REP-associated tyrosine transposase
LQGWARPLRIEFPDALYHVTARGNERKPIVRDDLDRALWLQCLERVVSRFGWVVYAYCLMDNHVHLVVETPVPNLARGMRELNGVYAQRFNRRHAAPATCSAAATAPCSSSARATCWKSAATSS